MYDIKPLEEEWKKYRKKKLRPWYIGTLTLHCFDEYFNYIFWQ